jgi:hypothetical protein
MVRCNFNSRSACLILGHLLLCPFWFEQFIIDMKHQLTATVRDLILTLTDNSDLKLREQLTLEPLQNSIPLFGYV